MTSFFTNLKSGTIVFLVALPLCLGIALACNVPLFAGVLAGIVGGIIVTVFSGSQVSVSGPAAGLTAIVISAVASLGSYEHFLAAVIFAGLLQIVFGVVKAGSAANFIPLSVIKGMLAGIGIILIMKQVPHLVGYDRDPEGDFEFEQSDGHNTISDLYYMFNYITEGAAVIGFLSIAILLFGETKWFQTSKFKERLPLPLLVVVLGAALSKIFEHSSLLVLAQDHKVMLPIITGFENFKSNLFLPDFSLWKSNHFWVVVLTLAAVASLETLLSIEASDKLDPKKRESNSNKELVAQGIGNIVCGSIGALPVTSVIVRSSANISAGATGKLSAILHAVLLFITVVFMPNVLMLIPNASLAAILIMTGYKLSKLSMFKELYQKGLDQFLPFIVTIVVMLITDLLKGVGAGLVVAVVFIIRNNIQNSFEVIEDTINGKKNYLIKLPQHITFFNKGFVINYLRKIEHNSQVVIDGSITKTTDKDVKEVLLDFVETAKHKNIEIQFFKYVI